MRARIAPDETPGTGSARAAPQRRRMPVEERERQILDGAIQFFAQHGFEGQLRELARKIGITHALLYHYFPTKQALIERVYIELFEKRWKPEWEALLDSPDYSPEEKLVGFYSDYARSVLTREFVRIFVYSGLSDNYITDNFFALLRERLFPRLVRETRRFRGLSSRAKPSPRELELLLGLHGGIFYNGVRRYIYAQPFHGSEIDPNDDAFIVDRVRSYLLSAAAILSEPQPAAAKTKRSAGGNSGAARATAVRKKKDGESKKPARNRGSKRRGS